MARALSLLAVLCAVAAPAADFGAHGRVWTGPGFDSNSRRDYVSEGVATQPDGFLFALGQLDAVAVFFDRWRFAGAYDVAARKFFLGPSEDTVVQSAQLESTVALGKYFQVGLAGRLRDRRGAERDYTDLVGGGIVDFLPDAALDVRLAVSAHRFLFYNRFAYSFWGPDSVVNVRYRFNRRHSASFFFNWSPRTYNAQATPYPGPEGTEEVTVRRQDTVLGAGLTYMYRGPFQFSVSYAYIGQNSNSYGETILRHRIGVMGGFRLPWQLMVLASATLQLSSFPDGVFLSPDLTVVEDEENSSSVTMKLVRPVTSWLDVDVRYALYVNVLPGNAFLYLRHVASIGLAASF